MLQTVPVSMVGISLEDGSPVPKPLRRQDLPAGVGAARHRREYTAMSPQRSAVMKYSLEIAWPRTRTMDHLPVRTREIGEILQRKYAQQGAIVRLIERPHGPARCDVCHEAHARSELVVRIDCGHALCAECDRPKRCAACLRVEIAMRRGVRT